MPQRQRAMAKSLQLVIIWFVILAKRLVMRS